MVLGVAEGTGDALHVRRIDPVRQWKLSPSDLASLDRWSDYTVAKETMFQHANTTEVPWTVVRRTTEARPVEAMRSVLARFDYPDKDHSVVGVPDPLIVGPPGTRVRRRRRALMT